MKWLTLIFWGMIVAGLYLFISSFSPYLYRLQEETQLFIPAWSFIRESLWRPGGFCTVVAQTAVQYYRIPGFGAAFNALLSGAAGVLSYLLLQRIARRGYNLLLALFPLLFLFKMQLRLNYVPDGTVGLLLLLSFLFIFTCLQKERLRLVYALLSLLFLFLMAGQLAFLYSVLLVAYGYCLRLKERHCLLIMLPVAAVLIYAGIRLTWFMPLTAGLRGEEFHESQLWPESYVYYVWIRFSFMLLMLFLVTFLMKYMEWTGKVRKILITAIGGVAVWLFAGYCMPDGYDVRNRMLYRLSYLAGQQEWEAIIRLYQGKKIPVSVDRNYLNLALARKGLLADRLFYFDQHGPQGLLTCWNGTYWMSVLLSDIHFATGDISLAESYAMEGLTLARRQSSPRMLQRLVQVSLIRGEWKLASKYLGLLSEMPFYRDWAEKHRAYLHSPASLATDPELAGKQLAASADDNLLCLLSVDSLWQKQVAATSGNRTALHYLGCSYLLGKKLDEFKLFLLRNAAPGELLPVHFQEAALLLAVDDPSVLQHVTVAPALTDRFRQFMQAYKQAKAGKLQPETLYRQYGNTFWFYYYYKEI